VQLKSAYKVARPRRDLAAGVHVTARHAGAASRAALIRFLGRARPASQAARSDLPSATDDITGHSADHVHPRSAPARIRWARSLKRVLDLDIERCCNGGGRLKIIAAIEEPPMDVATAADLISLAELTRFLSGVVYSLFLAPHQWRPY
jgi:hypothetical protein